MINRLQEYSAETAIATIVDGNANLKVNTRHLMDLTFRIGSLYQFIGELFIQPDNEVCAQQCLLEALSNLFLLSTVKHVDCEQNEHTPFFVAC